MASGETAVEGCFVRVCFSPRKNTEEHGRTRKNTEEHGKSQGVGEWGAGVFNHEFHECHESKAEIFGGGLDPGGRGAAGTERVIWSVVGGRVGMMLRKGLW